MDIFSQRHRYSRGVSPHARERLLLSKITRSDSVII